MATPGVDSRMPERRALDESIAAEPPLAPPVLAPDARPAPVEEFLASRYHRPVALAGVVENGLIRPLDPAVKLPENSRVIIVATDGS
jgi:hypothetical protein